MVRLDCGCFVDRLTGVWWGLDGNAYCSFDHYVHIHDLEV